MPYRFRIPNAEIPPNPPLEKGGWGDFWEVFSEGKIYFLQRAKVLQFLLCVLHPLCALPGLSAEKGKKMSEEETESAEIIA